MSAVVYARVPDSLTQTLEAHAQERGQLAASTSELAETQASLRLADTLQNVSTTSALPHERPPRRAKDRRPAPETHRPM